MMVTNLNADLSQKIIGWRRDFHQFPETGFLEMRTASIVASILDELGFDLAMGKSVMSTEHCMGKPDNEATQKHYQWAIENGANLNYIANFSDGYTGIVATLDTGVEGPTVAYRFDMDALDIHESELDSHFPKQEGFRSKLPHKMHACGHDAHTAIGLGFATVLANNKQALKGKIKLIFQPAEEGTRGAKSMASAGVVDDVDYFIASHVGTGVPHQHFVASNNGFLATSKLDITFKGKASHAGAQPEEGNNALLAAANAALNIHAISRNSKGISRINVGELHAGSGRNIIADHAFLKTETRGENSEVNQYIKNQLESIIAGAAQMYQVDYQIETVGEALSSQGSRELALILNECAEESDLLKETTLESNDAAGSEDATYFMERVKQKGGFASYCIFGTDLSAGHHNEQFDINEETMLAAVDVLYRSVLKINNK